MRFILFVTLFSTILNLTIYSQNQTTPKLYSHKVVVEEILQTKNYTYLQVKEIKDNADSLQWLALPSFEPAVGDIYFFENGLQMGEFQSKELKRTFSGILFLGNLSTSPEISADNLVPVTSAYAEDSVQNNNTEIHSVVVKEVLQTSSYTYLKVIEGEKEEWLAVMKIPAVVGQTYTYDDAAPMTDFKSKELNKTFKEVLFIANIKLKTDSALKEKKQSPNKGLIITGVSQSHIESKTSDLNEKPVEGEITIAALLKNKQSYAGKKVKIKGEVSKYSSDILNKNWIHIKDGTSFSGKSDLTLTTTQAVNIGDNIIVEGVIYLDKDFGSGYFFDVIMEEAKLMNE